MLIEIFLLVLCLYDFYGQKFKLGIKEISLMMVHIILMQAVTFKYVPSVFSVAIYLIVLV